MSRARQLTALVRQVVGGDASLLSSVTPQIATGAVGGRNWALKVRKEELPVTSPPGGRRRTAGRIDYRST